MSDLPFHPFNRGGGGGDKRRLLSNPLQTFLCGVRLAHAMFTGTFNQPVNVKNLRAENNRRDGEYSKKLRNM